MATRAERFRAEELRNSRPKPAPTTGPTRTKKPIAIEDRIAPARGVPARASYAFEAPAADGRRSRKSTRGSANRAKPDSSFNLRESMVKGSPEARFAKARAKNTRVRGSNG